METGFHMPDGRIIDTGNGNVSHTEGQGFAMLMAVENEDNAAARPV
jgi:endoglucanase